MAVNTADTKSSLDALYKDIYGDKLENLVPDFAVIQQKINFDKAKKNGRQFVQAVNLTHEHGYSYGSGLVTLEDAIQADNDDAKVTGSPFYLRTVFTYDAAAAMVSGGKEAFISGTEYRLMKMKTSAAYRLELQMLYGSRGLARTPATQTVVLSGAGDVDATVTIADAEWSPAIWAGAEGAQVAVFLASNGNAVAAATTNKFTVKSVDTANKKVVLTEVSAGDSADLKAAVDAAAHDIFWFGAKGNEMVGLRSIISNTGSLFGINGATYSLWQGNSFDVAGNLNLKKVLQATNKAVSKGLMDDVTCLVSPATFAYLANDEASLRRYPDSSDKAKRSPKGIVYGGPSGDIEIMSHPLIKEGEGMIIPVSEFKRIGASDVTFKTPGKEGEMFLQLPSQTGYECRLYSDQALFCAAPHKSILLTGITNS